MVIKREAAVARRIGSVLGWVATLLWWVGKAVLGIAKVLVGGPTRRRATLVVGAIVGGAGYLWLEVGVQRVLELLVRFVFGIPAPGRPLAPGTWLAPQNGLWPDIMLLSQFSMGVAGLLVLVLIARATMASDEAVRRRELKRVGRPAAMVAATWTLLPVTLHLIDQLASALAPTPAMLLDAMGSTAGAGLILGIMTWFAPIVVAIGVLATILLRAIVLVGFVFWPVAVVARSFEHELLTRLGRSVTAGFSVAVVAKLLQAVFAFLVVFLTGTVESLTVRLGVFVGGVVVVLVALPIVMLRHAEQMMLLPGALAPTERQAQRYVQESAKRVGQVHTRLESGRERVTEWRETDPQTALSDFTGSDSSRWGGWIQRDLRSHTSADWTSQSSDGVPSDGAGPSSRGPDESSSEAWTNGSRDSARHDDQ